MFTFENGFPYAAREAIESRASYIWENLFYCLENGTADTLEELEDEIDDHMSDGTNAVNLDLEDRLSVCEYLSEETGWEDVSVRTWGEIRSAIEGTADACIEEYAKSACREALEELGDLLDTLGLDLTAVRRENGFGWAVHRAEREESEGYVYEYRGVEGGEIDVDVWQVEILSGVKVYLYVFLTDEGSEQ